MDLFGLNFDTSAFGVPISDPAGSNIVAEDSDTGAAWEGVWSDVLGIGKNYLEWSLYGRSQVDAATKLAQAQQTPADPTYGDGYSQKPITPGGVAIGTLTGNTSFMIQATVAIAVIGFGAYFIAKKV